MPVNTPSARPGVPAGSDERLYLRDQELDQAAALIRAAARKLNRLVEAAAAGAQLSGPELDVLQELLDRGAMDVGSLRDRLNHPRQSLARNLAQLESRGLIGRETAHDDRRRREVTLTSEGMRVARLATEARRAALRRAFLSTGPESVNGARRVLADLLKPEGGAR
jgi:DNA-binding MarR family transcriptional regulator